MIKSRKIKTKLLGFIKKIMKKKALIISLNGSKLSKMEKILLSKKNLGELFFLSEI